MGLMLFSVGAPRRSCDVTGGRADAGSPGRGLGLFRVGGLLEEVVGKILQCSWSCALSRLTRPPGDAATTRSQNRRTRHDTRQANSIRVVHQDISNRFGLIADSPQRRGREPLVARFIDAPVIAVVKLANSARSVFMSAGWKSNFTDPSTCSRFYCHVSTQNGDGPLGFEDGQMNTVGVGVPVFAQHRL